MAEILLIDDDPTIQKVFSQFLSREGHEVVQAENGLEGMEMLKEHQPDLIITDIMMPEMDGLEILLKLRKIRSDLPIIAISGGMRNLPINFLGQARMFGARYVFEKPVLLEDLLSAVNDLIGSKE